MNLPGTVWRPQVGVVGLKRGLHLANWCRRVGLDVVAGCDRDPERRADAKGQLPGAVLTARWEDLLALDLDAVVLANDFDAHAPLALAFLERGVHVLSEAAACTNEDEGRRLIKAVERSTATYSFAENYVAHPHVRAIRETVGTGEVGRVELIEADYLHGISPDGVAALVGDPSHWRGRIVPTAYCTHTMSPVLAITSARPGEVTAFTVDEADPRAVVMVVRLSTGALAVSRHGFLQGEADSHWSWVSVRGTRGLAESVRGAGERAWSVRVRTEAWASATGRTIDEERTPPPLVVAGEVVARAAKGTGSAARGVPRHHRERRATAGPGAAGRRRLPDRRHGSGVIGERLMPGAGAGRVRGSRGGWGTGPPAMRPSRSLSLRTTAGSSGRYGSPWGGSAERPTRTEGTRP